jgi:thiamine-phosphate pyrophosphorylase
LRLPAPPLLVITDRHGARLPLAEVAAACFAGGCRWLSLREKDMPAPERLVLLKNLVALGRRWNAAVLVHGDIEAARVAGAAGVHLPSGGSPQEARRVLGPDALIGFSAHDYEGIVRAEEAGADYVTLSPIFESRSKPGYGPALGLDELADLAAKSAIPVIALGGIGPAEAASCVRMGAAGVAVMSGVMAAANPQKITSALVAGLASA